MGSHLTLKLLNDAQNMSGDTRHEQAASWSLTGFDQRQRLFMAFYDFIGAIPS